MQTYWLLGKTGDHNDSNSESVLDGPSRENSICQSNSDLDDHHRVSKSELPGEITTIESPTYSASLFYPMPGRPTTTTRNSSTDKRNDIPPISEIKVDPPTPTTDDDNRTIIQTTPM
jgi:hypothetical protein